MRGTRGLVVLAFLVVSATAHDAARAFAAATAGKATERLSAYIAAQRAIASIFGEASRDEGQRLTALSALLLLGAVGSRVRDSDSSRFSRISEEIDRAASAENGDLSDRIAALEAVANLEPNEVPAVVKEALQSEEELVRVAAIHAVAIVSGSDAEARLHAALASDSDEQVRLASAEALAARGASGLQTAALEDASEDVRMTCLSALAAQAPGEPTMVLLRRAAREVPSEDVRNLAASLLAER